MKKLFVLFSFFSVLFIQSCATDPVSEEPKDSGKILLKIDKQNAPENVVFVKAYLTRENHPPITGTLNLQSDSTADILLNNIDAGQWHLKVDAEDDSGLVLYTGETEVQIFAGFTSQVYLTLSPTGSGTGSIYISVNWGVPLNNTWIDYYNNPMITSTGHYFDPYGVAQPVVLYEDGLYRMWYTGIAASGRMYILYTESIDGIHWTQYQNNPVLSPGAGGDWDNLSVTLGAMIKENGLYKLYYTGWSNENDNWHIGLATSPDGKNWTKYTQPVLTGTYGWEHQIVSSAIIRFNNTYYLYYTGRNLPVYKIGVATSTDGINFSKFTSNPILVNDKPWEQNGVLDGSVIVENGMLKMVYVNSASSGFGFANSTDGFNWIKENNNPFITNNNTANNWADIKITYPYLVKTNKDLRIYYTGLGTGASYFKIGMMKK